MYSKKWEEEQANARAINRFANDWKQNKIQQTNVVNVEPLTEEYKGSLCHLLVSQYYNGDFFATDVLNGKTYARGMDIDDLGVAIAYALPKVMFDEVECCGREIATNYPPELIKQMKSVQNIGDKPCTNEEFIQYWCQLYFERGQVAVVESKGKIHQLLLSEFNDDYLATDIETGITLVKGHNQQHVAIGLTRMLDHPQVIVQDDNPFMEDQNQHLI